MHAISIAVGFPKGWNPHRRYPLLTPSIELLLAFQKGNVTWEEYVEEYQEKILKPLNPMEVVRNLGKNAILVCWERSNITCHRKLVADWITQYTGIVVTEL